jgi:hypothetical protein
MRDLRWFSKVKTLKYTAGAFLFILLAGFCASCVSWEVIKNGGYSRLEYSFALVGMVRLSGSVYDQLAGADGYPHRVTLYFTKGQNEIATTIYAEFFMRKPYDRWHVSRMTVTWDGGSAVLLEDETFIQREWNYRYGNGWYLMPFPYFSFARVNFEKVFKGKEHGDQFPLKVLLSYSFDDEAETEEEFEFLVTTRKFVYMNLWVR